ncbi:hypothetical protein RM780_22395 [Streptomyces sp. DSM 44917]|uniref:Uncharacterized protein n=1 Tax=Streptomyces boetiae TaxID=3075541 RepID=A0ABU2LDW8_9ACTN|nr:hypothetical protein [Streptomyces sp. DSM 44917]
METDRWGELECRAGDRLCLAVGLGDFSVEFGVMPEEVIRCFGRP